MLPTTRDLPGPSAPPEDLTGAVFFPLVQDQFTGLWEASALLLSSVGGTATAYTASVIPPMQSGLVAGMRFILPIATTNTGPVTLNIDGAGAKSIKSVFGNDLEYGDLPAGGYAQFIYTGAQFVLLGFPGDPWELAIAASDETTTITAASNKARIHVRGAIILKDIRASLNVAQTGGSIFTVDVNVNGSSILSTKLTIDNNETTSNTAATALVFSGRTLADDDLIGIDVDQVGTGSPSGLKLNLWGTRLR